MTHHPVQKKHRHISRIIKLWPNALLYRDFVASSLDLYLSTMNSNIFVDDEKLFQRVLLHNLIEINLLMIR